MWTIVTYLHAADKAQPYLQFTKEPVDGVLAYGADPAAVQCDVCIGFAVGSRDFL